MVERKKLTTQEKALQINLSKAIYGSFAEIGAGQEVAANFFKVGGASGTIAKTISAYDMKFSDAIYGVCERYVCEDRLIRMLDKEYTLLPERLSHRIADTRFFAFADTVEVLNFERTNQGHGWIGLRFQLRPNSEPNDCVIHVKMFDNDPLQQQFALGIVGVNMLYGCMFLNDPDVDRSKIVVLTELTLNDLSPDGKIDEKDFLYRADIICSLGQTVLVSNYFEYYRLVDYLSRMTKGKKTAIIMGIYALQKVFEEKTYENIRGGILESFASLFGSNVRLYIYPAWKKDSHELFTLKDFESQLPVNVKNLFRYLMDNNKLEDIEDANVANLHIISDNVLAMIRKGEPGWEKFVPHKVEEAIKEHGLFDYPYQGEKQKVEVAN